MAEGQRGSGGRRGDRPEHRLPRSGIDYHQVAEEELIRAILRGRPQNLRRVGDGWHRLGSALHERAAELDDEATALGTRWQGTAFEEYRAMIRDIVAAARAVASVSLDLRDVAYDDAEALSRAQQAVAGLAGAARSA